MSGSLRSRRAVAWLPVASIRRRLICIAVALMGLGLAFGYGVGVGFYRWSPFAALKSAQDAVVGAWIRRALDDEKEVLRFAFTDPLIEGDQIHGPITSLNRIYEANRSMMLPVERFFDAYDHLEVIDAAGLVLDRGATYVLQVIYELGGTQYDAYAYAANTPESGYVAALIIPGSGLNQSSAIYKNDSSNYQFGIVEALGPCVDKFVLIKPNEDCLAFHDGKAKLSQGFFINWLLNMGGSYSAQYITNSLAITKYLRNRYKKVVVAGLSQGGAAALLNSLQSQPHAAIIASGFSVNARDIGVDHDRIIIPRLWQRLNVEGIRSRMQILATSFLFTYGKSETGVYGIAKN